jgi:hypothetical protein
MMFGSKRGQAMDILAHPAFVIFVAVLVLFYLLWFVHGLGSDMSFEKKFLATDMALTVDSLLASRDNVILYYLPQSGDYMPEFNYLFDKNVVTVFESSKDEGTAGSYYFTSDPSVRFGWAALKPGVSSVLPRFYRLGNSFAVDDAHAAARKKINMHALSCPEQGYDYGSIAFDPAHGFDAKLNAGDRGFSAGLLNEFELTREIGNFVKVLDIGKLFGVFTRDSDVVLSVDDRKRMVVDSVVSLHIGSVKSGDVFVKAYVNYGSKRISESLKLACELANAVSSALVDANVKVFGVAVIPVIPANEGGQFGILVEDRPAVLLEVGNVNMFSQDAKKAIASGIIEGVRNAR